MTEWREIKIADLGKVVTGKTPPTSKPEYYDGTTQFLTPTDMDGRRTINQTLRYLSEEGENKVRSSLLPKGSVSVSCIGSDMGKTVLLGKKSVTNQQINSIIVSHEFDNLFVYYNLSGRKSELQFLANGAAQPIMNKNDFSNLTIKIPHIVEQKTIASVLGALDDKIENNQRVSKMLEEMARAVFKSWFVDFDPVHAKVAGNSPHHMDNKTAALFPSSFNDDGLPEGWTKSYISKFAFRVKDKFEKGQSWDDEKLIDLARMPSNSIALNEYGEGKELSTSINIFKKNDFLFGSIRPYFCKAGLAPFDGITNSSVFILRCYEKKDNAFLYALCSSQSIFNKSIQFSKGTKMPIISWSDFSKFETVDPAKIIRDKFSSITLPMFEKIQNNVLENQKLAKLRDTLAPKLMSGEVRVKNIKSEVESAT